MEAVLGSIHECLPEGDGWRRQAAKQSSLIHHCAKLGRRKLGIIVTERFAHFIFHFYKDQQLTPSRLPSSAARVSGQRIVNSCLCSQTRDHVIYVDQTNSAKGTTAGFTNINMLYNIRHRRLLYDNGERERERELELLQLNWSFISPRSDLHTTSNRDGRPN